MSSRAWCFTVNNYADEDEVLIKGIVCRYIVFGHEVGECGTPHLQGYIYFKSAKTLRAVLRQFAPIKPHLEPAKGDAETNRKYCTKEDVNDFFEDGDRPRSRKEIGEDEQARWRKINEVVMSGNMDQLLVDEPELWNRNYAGFRRIEKDYMKRPPDLETVCGVWVYGPPMTGKSTFVRAQYPGYFDKTLNKWWDGYQREPFVLLDDFDTNHKCLGSHLKRWADRYAFPAEIKQSAISCRPLKIIVTSNYHPSEIWNDDAMLLQAIVRRFEFHHMTEVYCGIPGQVGVPVLEAREHNRIQNVV